MIGVCLSLIAAMVGSFYSTYAPVLREEDKLTHFINPTSYIYATGKYLRQRWETGQQDSIEPIGVDARLDDMVSGTKKHCWSSGQSGPFRTQWL